MKKLKWYFVILIFFTLACSNRSNLKEEDLLYAKGVEEFSKRNFKQSIKFFNQSLAAVKYNETHNIKNKVEKKDIYLYLGKAYLENFEGRKAKKYFEKVLESSPIFVEALKGLGVVYLEYLENYKRAKTLFEQVLTLDPLNKDGYHYLGITLLNLREIDQAFIFLNKAIELGRKETDTYYSRGLIYQMKGDFNKAYHDYIDAIALNSQAIYPIEGVVTLLFQTENFDQAIYYQKILITLAPFNRFGHFVLSILEITKGNFISGIIRFSTIWLLSSLIFILVYTFLVSFKSSVINPHINTAYIKEIFKANKGIFFLILIWFLLAFSANSYLIYQQMKRPLNPFENSLISLKLDFVIFPLFIAFSLIYIKRYFGSIIPKNFISKINRNIYWGLKGLLYTIVFALGLGYIIIILLEYISIDLTVKENTYAPFLASASTPLEYLLAILSAGILAPLCEEIFFRGIIYRRLKSYHKTRTAIIATSIFFAIFHLTLGGLPILIILGLVLTYIYIKTGSVMGPFITHSLYNLLLLISVLLNTPKI